jgi:hypothetical protein
VRQAEAERQAARRRTLHPDLVEMPDGDLQFHPFSNLPPAERDFRRTWADPSERAAFMERVADRQRGERPEVQQAVQGRSFGADPYSGYQVYLSELEAQRDMDRMVRHGLNTRVVTTDELARMSLEETDQVLDEHGQPREGVVLELRRGVDVRRGIDPSTAREMRRRG